MMEIYKKPCSEYSPWSGYSCAWDCNGFGGFCGDGIVAPGDEQCEADQSCTLSDGSSGVNKCVDCQLQGCEETATVSGPCGDGTVDEDEACDRGEDNGIKCTPAYPQKTCSYCSADCKNVITVDLLCGNGSLDDGEACDPLGQFEHARTFYPWIAISSSWLIIPGDYCYTCNNTCTGWDIIGDNSASSVCASYTGYCGDGIVQKILPFTSGYEECDGSAAVCPSCSNPALPTELCSSNCVCDCGPAAVFWGF
jgi:hypothetical protein